MKCKNCGEKIGEGNLYCSRCGAEVQIVSPVNVMEEEFFLDFQNREMHRKPSEQSDGELYGQAAKQYRRSLAHMRVFVAVSAVVFFLSAFLIYAYSMRKPLAADPYTELVTALARQDPDAVSEQLGRMEAQDAEGCTALLWRAWYYGMQGQTEQQMELLMQILEREPDNRYACRSLLALYVEAEDFESVYGLYERYEDQPLAELFTDYLVDEPVITTQPKAGIGNMLTLTAADGLNIYYTLDGSSPVQNGILYYAPIMLEAGTYTVTAVACNEVGYYSPVVTTTVTLEQQYTLDMPQVTPDSGTYASPQTIRVNVPQGCTAYYAWNGTPSAASAKYTGGITMREGNNVLSVILVDVYGNESSIQRMNYIYMP